MTTLEILNKSNVISLAAKRRQYAMRDLLELLLASEEAEAIELLEDFADEVEKLTLERGPSTPRTKLGR
jgi:bacterioferritin (cytochrome b1)